MKPYIDIWLCFNDDCDDETITAWRTDFLNDAERARAARFHFERDRKQCVITRSMARCILSRYRNVDPLAWEFGAGEHGRPFIVNPEADGLDFNLSHTKGLVVMAVADHDCFGVDCENFSLREAPLDVADHWFAAPEIARLRSLPLAQQQQEFFHYWSLKEAYIKARAMGLHLPLDGFGMDMSHEGTVEIRFYKPIEEDPEHWRFFLWTVGEAHVVTLAVRAVDVPRVRMWRVLPTPRTAAEARAFEADCRRSPTD